MMKTALLLLLCSAAYAATDNIGGSGSLGTTLGKVLVAKTGSLQTAAKTASQVILTYTVTTGKTLYLTGGTIEGTSQLSVPATTGVLPIGSVWWETPSGTAISSYSVVQTTGVVTWLFELPRMSEPAPIASGTVLRAVVTPNTASAVQWVANFIGYEK